MQTSVQHFYYIAVVGGAGVGKTALTTQFTQNQFHEEYGPEIDVSYRKLCVIDDQVASLDVLDTHDEFTAVREPYMRDIEGALFVYSITSRDTFEEVKIFHQQMLRVRGEKTPPFIIVANKCDLEHERQIGIDEGHELANNLNCKFIETSAKNRTNVDEAFSILVREINRYRKEQQTDRSSAPSQPDAQASPDDSTRCLGGCVIL